MEEKTTKQLNLYYYGMMSVMLIVLGVFYFMQYKQMLGAWQIDRMSTAGLVIQYAVILDALLTIPGGLYGFKRLCDKVRAIEDEELKYATYTRYAAVRIVLVSNSMILGIIAFYLLGCYESMLWVSAISAISWYFTKPTPAKIQVELRPRQENEETY